MMLDQIPEDSWRREIIVIRDEVGIDELIRDSSNEVLFNSPNVVLLNATELMNRHQAGKPLSEIETKLLKSGLIRNDVTLYQSPFDSIDYVLEKEVLVTNAFTKMRLLTTFAHYLGAKKTEVTLQKDSVKKSKMVSKNSASKNWLNGTLEAQIEQITNYSLKQYAKVESAGSDPDIELARSFLELNRLSDENEFRNLLHLRAPGNNHLKNLTFSTSLTTETIRSIKLSAGLNVGPLVKAKVRFDHDSLNKIDIKVDMTFDF